MRSLHRPSPRLAPPPASFNMVQYVLRHADDLTDKIALSIVSPTGETDQHWSFAQLERAVRGVAGGLIAQGLQPGDRVLLRLGNTVDFPLAFLGAIAAGLVPIPSSSQLTTPEITKLAALVRPRMIIADHDIALPDPTDAPVIDVDALHQLASGPPAPFHMGDANRPGYIVFTSGTSGDSRAVLHAHRAIWARQMMWEGWYGLRADDRLMHAGAFNWTYTLGTGLMDPWSAGATALIPAAGTPPTALGPLLARHQATLFAAAPGVFRQMLKGDLPPLPNLRHALSAGEKLPQITQDRWHAAADRRIYEAYGMSECSTFVSGSPTRPAEQGTLGFAQPGRHLAVLDDDGQPVPRGQPGTMAIHRDDPGLMLGYLTTETPENTPAPLPDWFLTGDTVSMSPTGAITYQGRADDIMNAGGFRVSPLEVEAVMTRHPGVHDAACVEVSVKEDASIIACFYVPEQAPVAPDALSDHAHTQLAHYKVPRLFVPVDSLPRGANNKLARAQLRKNHISDTY